MKIESLTVAARESDFIEQALDQLIESAHFRRSSRSRGVVALIGRLSQLAKTAGVVEWIESRTRAVEMAGESAAGPHCFLRQQSFRNSIICESSLVVRE